MNADDHDHYQIQSAFQIAFKISIFEGWVKIYPYPPGTKFVANIVVVGYLNSSQIGKYSNAPKCIKSTATLY